MPTSSDDEEPLISDPTKVSEVEARNALLQYDEVRRLIPLRIGNLQLSAADVLNFQRLAVRDIWRSGGQYRHFDVEISNSSHAPPPWVDVPRLVEEMCDHANEHQAEALYCSSYLMWRLNWIHPFEDGNGRTSRAISYLALCAALGVDLPGSPTVPEQISQYKEPYYAALEAADEAWSNGRIDVIAVEVLIADLLKKQLSYLK
jgi:Fic family protein